MANPKPKPKPKPALTPSQRALQTAKAQSAEAFAGRQQQAANNRRRPVAGSPIVNASTGFTTGKYPPASPRPGRATTPAAAKPNDQRGNTARAVGLGLGALGKALNKPKK